MRDQLDTLAELLDRLKPPLTTDAFNEVLAGKPDFMTMLLRDDEEGCQSILAQQMQDQTANDIANAVNFLRDNLPAIREQADEVERLRAALLRIAETGAVSVAAAGKLVFPEYHPRQWARAALNPKQENGNG